MASSPCHGAIRNFIHPINAELFLEVTFSTWLQSLEFFFLKRKVDSTSGRGKPFLPVNVKNADLDFNPLQMQHNSLITPAGSLLNP